jgi:hypothetical protein
MDIGDYDEFGNFIGQLSDDESENEDQVEEREDEEMAQRRARMEFDERLEDEERRQGLEQAGSSMMEVDHG